MSLSFISPLRGLIGLMLPESVEPLFFEDDDDDDEDDDDPVGGYESLKGSSLLLLLPHSLSAATSGTKTSPSADTIPPCGCGSNSGKPFPTVIVTKEVFLLTCISVLDMLE